MTESNPSQFIIYQSEDGETRLDVRFVDETVWLTQALMAEIFSTTPENVLMHLKNIYKEGELEQLSTTKDFLVVRQEGSRQVKRTLKHYNLDAIISVGYRIKSQVATQFRIWATERLKEYIIKGFALNDERFKTGNSMNYFNELQDNVQSPVICQCKYLKSII